MQPRPGDERVGVEVIYGEVGRADELQAQTMSNLSPPSEIEDFSYGRRTMGCKLKGLSGLGQILGGLKSSGMKGRSREEESTTRKGKAPVVSDGRLHAGGKDDRFKDDVVQPLPSKHGSLSCTTE